MQKREIILIGIRNRLNFNISSCCFGLLIVLTTLGGCATEHPHLMATPVVYKDQRIDVYSQTPPAAHSTEVPVFFASRRAPVEQGEPGHYAYKVSEEGMRLGVAQVQLGNPDWTFEQLVASDQTSKVEEPRPGRVLRIDEFGIVPNGSAPTDVEREFIARINAQIARVRNPEVVLYVHGYRTTFDEVAVIMGSLSSYLGSGATVAFMWPTGLHWWNYLSDCPDAEKFVPDIERTIELLSQTKAQYINMLAYSCGSPLLAQALANLRGLHPNENHEALTKEFRIGNVIFTASDIDLKTFAGDYVPSIMDLSKQTIVYYSRRDAALVFSSIVAGASRIGRPDINDLSPNEINNLATDPHFQAIDVTDVRGSQEMGGIRGHGYWYANEWISTDVLLSLRYPIPPAKRCLIHKPKAPNVWLMPDTYPDCIVGALLKAYPQLKRTNAPAAARPVTGTQSK